jgi:hypothetical protein
MSPADAIEMLDRQIAEHGQTITLERLVPNQPAVTATVRGFTRGYKPDELANGVQQGDSTVVLSPSSLAGTPFAATLPTINNKAVFHGRRRNVIMADPVYINDVLVRVNLQVRG